LLLLLTPSVSLISTTLDMQLSQEQLHKKNQELVEMYREKSKKHAQVTNLYNLLKSRAMRSQIQSAASDSVSHVLESLSGPRPESTSFPDLHQSLSSHTPVSRASLKGQYPMGRNGIEQLHPHQKSGSGSGSGNVSVNMDHDHPVITSMPPPNRPASSRNR
jgi:E3 ubiquitin-protein ligase CCNP1IP1